METVNELKSVIAQNLIKYRKENCLTQQELAEKLNYSDKSISKWERGEGVPDIYILKQIAELYNITVNDIIGMKVINNEPAPIVNKTKNHVLITLMSIGLVWLVATITFAILKIIFPNTSTISYCYIYAIPITFIVLYVFNRIWFKIRLINFLSVSLIFWSSLFSFYWTIKDFFNNFGVLFFTGIPFQVIVVFWYLMDRKKNKR
jgi:transcriptional regulator with XRE-family HTH domain